MKKTGTGARLIIVCGLPGSGKTTYAKELEGRLNAVYDAATDLLNPQRIKGNR